MNRSIEQIKLDGMKNELDSHIRKLIHELSNKVWSNIYDRDHYSKLGQSINRADEILSEIREVFEALKELDSRNN